MRSPKHDPVTWAVAGNGKHTVKGDDPERASAHLPATASPEFLAQILANTSTFIGRAKP